MLAVGLEPTTVLRRTDSLENAIPLLVFPRLKIQAAIGSTSTSIRDHPLNRFWCASSVSATRAYCATGVTNSREYFLRSPTATNNKAWRASPGCCHHRNLDAEGVAQLHCQFVARLQRALFIFIFFLAMLARLFCWSSSMTKAAASLG